ncbi:hypothetical protein BDZ91DRAFT_493022 [Kalaharituber pfeilii]|nr:hypothetical protein BDZ91DRAFT_493022 [Kalaharituber pfeilii]
MQKDTSAAIYSLHIDALENDDIDPQIPPPAFSLLIGFKALPAIDEDSGENDWDNGHEHNIDDDFYYNNTVRRTLKLLIDLAKGIFTISRKKGFPLLQSSFTLLNSYYF